MLQGADVPLVLVVEAHQDTRELYRRGLEEAGFRVMTAEHPAEALYAARAEAPAAVVTELVLPDITGVAFARALRDMPETTATQIIAVTGATRTREVRAAERAGCCAVMLKPCLPHDLALALRRVLDTSQAARARAQVVGARAAMLRARADRVLLQSAVIRSRRAAQQGEHLAVPCPSCGGELRWREHQVSQGARFDYFDPCASGCGEYFYIHSRRLMRRLRR